MKIIAAIIALIAMTFLGSRYKIAERDKSLPKNHITLLKGGATACAALLALFAAFTGGGAYAYTIAIGLFICAIADMVLETHFVPGMGVFALGHVAYIVAFLQKGALNLYSIIIYAVMVVVTYFVSKSLKNKTKENIAPYVGYANIILLMLALSIFVNPLAFIGALFFAVSDSMIAYRLVFGPAKFNDYLCITLYYLGQYLIALSAFA